jgi:hypothetical protein
MIAKNGTLTLATRVDVPFLAIMTGCRGLSGASGQDRRFGFNDRAERG